MRRDDGGGKSGGGGGSIAVDEHGDHARNVQFEETGPAMLICMSCRGEGEHRAVPPRQPPDERGREVRENYFVQAGMQK